MPRIEIYVRMPCAHCALAKRLLASKGQTWEEIDVTGDPARMEEMIQRSGGRLTAPEIFIDGRLVGGYQELAALEQSGGLDALLEAGA